VPTEFKGSQAIARAVNVRARRPRRKRGTNWAMCGTEVLAGLCRDVDDGIDYDPDFRRHMDKLIRTESASGCGRPTSLQVLVAGGVPQQ
jgi:hypothetical protein